MRGKWRHNKKSLMIAGLIILVVLIGYHAVTRITFADNQAKISSLYCKFGASAPQVSKPVILIPGTKGSLLAKGAEALWLTPGQALHHTGPLIYNPADTAVHATGILSKLTIIPLLVEYAPYALVSSALACSPHAYFFYYDWRKNPLDHVASLATLVSRVERETGQKPSLIAHSMGGLIAHLYLKDHAESVDKVVYVAVPFQAGLSYLEDIDKGSSVGLNHGILSPLAVFSHPGSFALLPKPGTRTYKHQDLMEIKTWKDNRLSVYADPRADYDEALGTNLAKAKMFYQLLEAPRPMQNQFLFVMGNCRPTLYAIAKDGAPSFRPGDGRVFADSFPVEYNALRKQVITSCAPHDQFLNDANVVKAILEFLR